MGRFVHLSPLCINRIACMLCLHDIFIHVVFLSETCKAGGFILSRNHGTGVGFYIMLGFRPEPGRSLSACHSVSARIIAWNLYITRFTQEYINHLGHRGRQGRKGRHDSMVHDNIEWYGEHDMSVIFPIDYRVTACTGPSPNLSGNPPLWAHMGGWYIRV